MERERERENYKLQQDEKCFQVDNHLHTLDNGNFSTPIENEDERSIMYLIIRLMANGITKRHVHGILLFFAKDRA